MSSKQTILSKAECLNALNSAPKQLSSSALNFILPPVCLNCHEPLIQPNQLCSKCWSDIDFLMPPLCQINGTPLPFDIGDKTISAAAIAHPPEYDSARSVASYQGTMRELIHKLKYQDRHELTTLLATWLIQFGKTQLTNADLIIPIPLHRWRLWQRRFNQSTLLSKRISEITNIPVDWESFQRSKKTSPQVGLSSKQRRLNVAGAFNVPKHRLNHIENKTIILIDDVVTTGTTVNSAAKTLKKAGASEIYVLSLARVYNDSIENL